MSHFSLAKARPRALRTVDEGGTTRGTTKTVERSFESSDIECDPLVPLMIAAVRAEDNVKIACCQTEEEPFNWSRIPCFLGRITELGIGRVRDASNTEYCKSQSSKTISEDAIPAMSTWEEPTDSSETS